MFSHHLLFGGYYVASEREECVVACMREFFLNSWLLKLNRILTSNVGFFSFFAGGLQCDWEFCTRWANVNEYTFLPNCSIWFKCLCILIQQWYHTHQSTQSWGLANAFGQQWWKHMIRLFKFLAEVFGPLPHWATKVTASESAIESETPKHTTFEEKSFHPMTVKLKLAKSYSLFVSRYFLQEEYIHLLLVCLWFHGLLDYPQDRWLLHLCFFSSSLL